MSEQWRAVVGYEGWYEVSDRGCVKRIRAGRGARAGRILRPMHVKNRRGAVYHKVTLVKENVRRQVLVHRIVCRAFHGEAPSPQHYVDHIDWMTQRNRAANLRWVTPLESGRHRNPNAAPPRGSQISRKLNDDDVRTIRRRASKGEPYAAIGRDYKIVGNHIGRIVRRVSWAHVK